MSNGFFSTTQPIHVTLSHKEQDSDRFMQSNITHPTTLNVYNEKRLVSSTLREDESITYTDTQMDSFDATECSAKHKSQSQKDIAVEGTYCPLGTKCLDKIITVQPK